jgi:predicted ATPase
MIMPISEQILKQVHFHQLKGLTDLSIDFTEKPLTAILGPNGIGKSTILHAIACINNPVAGTVNHRLSEFFTPTTHSVWTGSKFDVVQSHRDGQNVTPNQVTHFRKEKERWSPRYVTRLPRHVSYIGIRTCVPRIESETQQARIQFNTTALTDAVSNQVRQLAGEVMNRNYTAYNEHVTGSDKRYIGVSIQGLAYSSLSMGAGEQRIFYILSEVLKAPSHGLIIIDEIDLLLHQDALVRLVERLHQIATRKHLQIIFTTHAQSLLAANFIAFRHLYQTPAKTLCFTTTKPDALQRLTGQQLRPLEVFVEDDLAGTMIKKICSEDGLSKYVSIKEYGAAINCFTAVSGSILNNLANQEHMLFVLDGDEYRSDAQKTVKIQRVLTGTTALHDAQRQLAFDRITQFTIPEGAKPEQYYHGLICALEDAGLNDEQSEIVNAARQIGNPGNSHKFFDDIIVRMDFTRDVGLNKLVDLLSLTPEWAVIKENIKNWLDVKRGDIVEVAAAPAPAAAAV